jgi:hypothetical protein
LKASRLLPAALSRCQQVEIHIEPAHKLDFRAQRLKKKASRKLRSGAGIEK